MKKQAYQIIALLILTASLAMAAQAQTAGRTKLRATIPFEFTVGEKMMPAGEYTIARINPSSDRTVLQLRSNDGRNSGPQDSIEGPVHRFALGGVYTAFGNVFIFVINSGY